MRFASGMAWFAVALTGCSAGRLPVPSERRAASPRHEAVVVPATSEPGAVEPDVGSLARRFGPLLPAEEVDSIALGETVEEVAITSERARRPAPSRRREMLPPAAPRAEKDATADERQAAGSRVEPDPARLETRAPWAELVVAGPRAELWLDVVWVNASLRAASPAPAWMRSGDRCWMSSPRPYHEPSRMRAGPPQDVPETGSYGVMAPVFAPLPPVPPDRARRLVCRRGFWLTPRGGELTLQVELPRPPGVRRWQTQTWTEASGAWKSQRSRGSSIALRTPNTALAWSADGRELALVVEALEDDDEPRLELPTERVLVVDRSSAAALTAAQREIERWREEPPSRFAVLLVDVEAAWWRGSRLRPGTKRDLAELLEDLRQLRPEGAFSLAAALRALAAIEDGAGTSVVWVAPAASHWAGRRTELESALAGRRWMAPATGAGADLAPHWIWPDGVGRDAPRRGAFVFQKGSMTETQRSRVGLRPFRRGEGRARKAGKGFCARAAEALGLQISVSKVNLPDLDPELRRELTGERGRRALPVRLVSRPAPRSPRRRSLESSATRGGSPLLWLELARARAIEGDTAGAARALGSLVADRPGENERRRLAGYGLLALGLSRLATELFAGLAHREGTARAYAEYGLALEASGRPVDAARAWEHALVAPGPESARASAAELYRRLLGAGGGPAAGARASALQSPEPAPLHITLWWSSTLFDLDLWVLEPDGHRAEPGTGVSELGSRHPWNMADGAGPEAYAAHAPGRYDVLVRAASGVPSKLPAGILVVSDLQDRRELTSRWIPRPNVVSSVVSAVVGGRRGGEVTSTLPSASLP